MSETITVYQRTAEDPNMIKYAFGDVRVSVRRRKSWGMTAHEYNAKTRVYVSDAVAQARSPRLIELETEEMQLGEKRFSTRGEDRDVDRIYDRLNREIGRVKREAAAFAVRRLIAGDFLRCYNPNVTFRFSRHAGCSCPCSPGVIASDRIYDGGNPVDIWIDRVNVHDA